MKLKYKLPLILFAAFAVIITLTFAVSLTGSARLSRASQYESGRSLAAAEAEVVRSFLDIKVAELRSLEKSVLAIRHLNDKTKMEILSKLMYAYANRPAVSDVYVVFERGAYFDAKLTDEGKYFNIDAFHPEAGGGVELDVIESDDVDDDDDWYHVPKKTRSLHLTEPYEWTYAEEKNPRKMITLSAPLIADGKFIGAAGIDMELKLLRRDVFDKISAANENTGAYAVLISNEGVLSVHPQDKMLLEEIGEGMDAKERQALKDAIAEGEYYRVIEKDERTGVEYLTSYVPVRPEGVELPWSLGFITPLSVMQAEFAKTRNSTIVLGVICVILWGIFLLIFMSAIFGGVTRTVEALGRMAEGDGDLTIRLEERGKDEFGQMARGLNKLLDKLHKTIKTTQTGAENLSGASSDLHDLSRQLTGSAEAMLERSDAAAGESEEASGNVNNIASETERAGASATELSATAEQMGENLKSVVGAVEEMNESFNKMTDAARGSKAVADEAIAKVTDAKNTMDTLGAAAKEIGQFTNVIKDIAKKTNLLAINATVEAARAGEAGKGFAVVAGEVKQLATQSAGNANDITSRIERIQRGTSTAIDVINEVAAIMTEVCKLTASISEHIERQIKVSDDLIVNARQTNDSAQQVVTTIGEMADSIQTVAKDAAETASGVKAVSESIGVINDGAKKTNANALELKDAADRLKRMSDELDSIVSRFKT